MTKKYNVLVIIGRYQPFHSAHLLLASRATALADKLIFICGSANQPRTYKNPFTFPERYRMIYEATRGMLGPLDIKIEPNIDTIYNDIAWAGRIQEIVNKHTSPSDRVGIIGHKKDPSSYYLGMFPQWGFEEVELIEPLDATDIRDLYFRSDANMKFIKHVVPETTFDFLESFKGSKEYEQIIKEKEFLIECKKQYAGLKYAPIFVTADSLVIQSGHVLMIKRKAEPGKGLMALPGGYVNANTDRSVEDAAIRELREETKIKVPDPVLRGNIKDSRVFDAIDRSPRGRIITHCFKIVLPDGELPKVKGSDDAEKAKWIPISEIKSENHFDLIQWGLGQ